MFGAESEEKERRKKTEKRQVSRIVLFARAIKIVRKTNNIERLRNIFKIHFKPFAAFNWLLKTVGKTNRENVKNYQTLFKV